VSDQRHNMTSFGCHLPSGTAGLYVFDSPSPENYKIPHRLRGVLA
jgi:hypothetical protein